MRRALALAIAVASLAHAPPSSAQGPSAGLAPPVALAGPLRLEPFGSEQRAAGEKSSVLAGVLSWLVFPGIGSYYAGNSGHGTRHVLVAVGSIGASSPAPPLRSTTMGSCPAGARRSW